MTYRFETNLKELSFDKSEGFAYLSEWYVLSKTNKVDYCICNRLVGSYSIVINRMTKNMVHMGSTCVKHILGISESAKTITARLSYNFERGDYVNITDLDEYVVECILKDINRLSKHTCNMLLEKYKNDITTTGDIIRRALIRRINAIIWFEEQERLREERKKQQKEETLRLKEEEKQRLIIIEEQRQKEEKDRIEKEREAFRINYMFMEQKRKDEEDRKQQQRIRQAEDALYKKRIGLLIKKALCKYFKEYQKNKREKERIALSSLQNKSKKDFKKMTSIEKQEYLQMKLRKDILK